MILFSYAEVNGARAGFDTLESGLSLMTQAESPPRGVSPPNPVSFIASCSSLKTLARCLDVQSSHKSTSIYGAGSHSRGALAACQFCGSWLQRSCKGMPLIEHEATVDIILYLNGVMQMPSLGPIVMRTESSHLDVPPSETRILFFRIVFDEYHSPCR
jgi:hypothetical protein